MADVFLSYSRRDGEFVRGLVADLEARGKSVWLDTEGIEDGAVFPVAIRSAIEGSDSFVFVITPESAASQYCGQEVDHALSLNKRLVPVLRLPVPDDGLPEAIRVRNWIPYTADVDASAASERLVAALDADLEHVQAHTRWLVKALDWDNHQRDKSFLLRGSELASAESWLAGVRESADPAPTPLQREFLLAGRTASARRQRIIVGASLTAVVVAAGLAVFALISRSQAQTARNRAVTAAAVAQSRASASHSEAQLSVDPELAVLLGMSGVRSSATAEAMAALRDALDASPVRFRLPDAGSQSGFYGCDCVAYSPDGRLLAQSSQHGYVLIMDAATGKVVRRITTHAPAFLGGWSPDGRLLIVGTEQAALVVDPATGKTRYRIPAMHYAQGLAFGPDGTTVYGAGFTPSGWKQLTTVGETAVRSVWVGSWSLAAGKYRAFKLPPVTSAWAVNQVDSLALRPDGRQLAVGAWPGIAVFDTSSGRPVRVAAPPWPRNATANTTPPTGDAWLSLAYSPDGSQLAGADTHVYGGNIGANGAWIRVLDAHTLRAHETAATLPASVATAVAFSRDGASVGYGFYNGTAGVYSLRAHKELVGLPGLTSALQGMTFSPDGTKVATATLNGDGRVWRAAGNEQLLISPGADPATSVIAALQRTRVVAMLTPKSGPQAGKIVVESWSRSDGRPLGLPLVVSPNTNPFTNASLSGDGRFVAVMLGTDPNTATRLQVWDITKRRLVKTLALPSGQGGMGLDPDTAWSRDDRYVAVPRPVGTQRFVVFDVAAGRILPARPTAHCPNSWSNHVAWSADASLLAATAQCGNLRISNPTTGHLAYATNALGQTVSATSFSPDGTRLILRSATTPGSVTVIDPRTGRHLLDLVGITAQVYRAFSSPDGKLIATSSADGQVRIWDAHTGALLRTIPVADPGTVLVEFGPDSESILTVDGANNIRIWDTCPDCGNPAALLGLAKTRVTRGLTPDEKQLYHVN